MTDVLIVGAGPVGLFFATECARRGIDYRIIESHATQSLHSKALAVFPRTLEIFTMAGVAEPFLQAANRVTAVAIDSHQRLIGRIQFTPEDTPFPFVAMVPQDVTERLLAERLRLLGGTVEYETTLTGIKSAGDGVEATVEHNGTPAAVNVKYVVGCDGAHSAVRQFLGLEFDGAGYSEQYMLADVMTNGALPSDEMQLCPSEFGPLAIFPISSNRRRLVGTVDEAAGTTPSLELVNGILAQRAPGGITAQSLVWSSYFKIHHRMVACMNSGRVFIAGDAAHIHSPFGGQGMNTGLQDAWNLAWKMNLAVRGLAAPALLDSYTQERLPVVRDVIKTTHFLTNALGARNAVARGIRDTIIPIATHLPQIQHAFVERLSGLAISYKGSPIVEGSGRRYFDSSFCSQGALGSRFILLAQADANTQVHMDALTKRFAGVLDVRSDNERRCVLIRPDGYVAFESHQSDCAALASVERTLRRQLRVL